jgi:hypothetical protein
MGQKLGHYLVQTGAPEKTCEQKGCSGCITFGSPDRRLNVLATSLSPRTVGENVELEQMPQAALTATWWMLVVPTLLMVAVVGLAQWQSVHQAYLLLSLITVLGLYFLLLKSSTERTVTFQIREASL